MMRIRTLPFLLALCYGCSGDATLEADPPSIKADGASSTTLTFDADLSDGIEVYFETDRGHFLDESGYETQYLTRSIAGGSAEVQLFAGIYPGNVTVTAQAGSAQATAIVEFTALRPSGNTLTFECDVVNLGALRQPVPDLAVPCHLRMQDRGGTPIDPRGLRSGDYGFVAEAGMVLPGIQDDGYGNVHFLYTATGGQTEPADVEPIDGEPSRSGDVGGTRNPRDGLVTIVAWVRGEEGFHDINSNGLFEPGSGETFTDVGEPFLDVDDDGEFDAGDGDTTIDLDGDGRYTPPNGSWDEDQVIWTTFKILWTGPVHESSSTSRMEIQGCDHEIRFGQRCEVVTLVLDRNINPVAAVSTDYVTVTPGCYSCSSSDSTFYLTNTRGFGIDRQGQIEGNLFELPVLSMTLENINSYEESETFASSAAGQATPGPQTSDGGYPDPIPISLSGFEATLLGAPSGG